MLAESLSEIPGIRSVLAERGKDEWNLLVIHDSDDRGNILDKTFDKIMDVEDAASVYVEAQFKHVSELGRALPAGAKAILKRRHAASSNAGATRRGSCPYPIVAARMSPAQTRRRTTRRSFM